MEQEGKKIPQGWASIDLGAITEKVETRSPNVDPEHEFSYIDIASIDNELKKITNPKQYQWKDAPSRAKQVVKANDIVFSTVRTYLMNVALVPSRLDGQVASTGFCVIRASEAICYKYLFYYTLSRQFVEALNELQRGTSYPAVRDKDIFAQQILLPPLAEQQRIVDKIEELFSDLDSGVESLKKAKQQLKVYRQAVLKWAFEGKLTAQWREEQQRQGKLESADTLLAQIKAEREQRYQKELEVWQAEVEAWEVSGQDGKKSRKPKKPKDLDPISSQELAELVSLPQSWQWERLGNLADIVGGVTKGRKLDDKSTISLPYLRVANVQDGYLDLEQIKHIDVLREDLEKYRLEYGDILYTEGGDRDKLGRGTIWKDEIENCIHQNHVFRARLFSDSINSSFIAYFSRTTLAKDYFFKRANQTVNLASINMTILSNFLVPISSPKEQIQILDEIESRLSICDQLGADIEANLKKSEVLRQSILKDAFEGQLVPQNPNDESASVLLERINQEKRKKNEESKEILKVRKKQSSKRRKREKMATLRDVLESTNSWMSAQELFRQCGIGDNSATDTIENLYLELRDFIKDGEVEVIRRDDEDWLRLVPMEEK